MTPNPNKLEIKWVENKGRGVFSKNLKPGSYICEYKVPKNMVPYLRKLRPAMKEEYERSGEGCFILEARDKSGKWWCFDATRCLNQYGWYLNHAPASMANVTLVPPVVVQGWLCRHKADSTRRRSGLGLRGSGRTLAKEAR